MSEANEGVCHARAPGSSGRLEVAGSDGHPGGEEKEGQDALLELKTDYEEEENMEKNVYKFTKILKDPQTLGLSLIKLYLSWLAWPILSPWLG